MLIQADPEAIQTTIEHLQRLHLAWLYHSREVEQSFNVMVLEMFAGDWQTNVCNEMGALYPQIACVADELTDLIGRFKCLLTRLHDADHYDGTTLVIPPPRIYVINGINSDAPPGAIDNDAQSMKDYIGGNTFIPDDQIVALTSVYNTDFTTRYDPISDGTALGTTAAGAGSATNTLTGVFNKLVGAGQVVYENSSGGSGPYTRQIYDEIQADIAKNPLLPHQQVIVVAHSGGGAIAGNLVPLLEKNDINVSNIVTFGSPVTGNIESSLYVDNLHIIEYGDIIGTPLIHSAIISPIMPFMPETHSIEYDYIDEHSGSGNHGAYWEHDGAIDSMATYIPIIDTYR